MIQMEVWWHMPLLAASDKQEFSITLLQKGSDEEWFPLISEESSCHKITNSEEQTHHLERRDLCHSNGDGMAEASAFS